MVSKCNGHQCIHNLLTGACNKPRQLAPLHLFGRHHRFCCSSKDCAVNDIDMISIITVIIVMF